MAKRGPQSELNDRNWDDEEEPEEAGVFKQATADTLQGRVIKKAKRRGAGEEGNGAKTTAFGGFGGLVKTNLDSGSTPMFGFGSKTTSTTDNKPFASGFSFKPTSSSTTNSDASESLKTAGAAISSNVGFSSSIKSSTSSSSSLSKDSSYLQALKDLNQSVLAWIKQHVDKNPYIILSPIFKDYDKYVASLESKKAATATTTASSSNGSSSAFSSSVLGNRNNGNDAKTTATTPGPTISSAFAPTKTTGDESGSNKDGKDKDTDTDGSTKATVNFGAASASNGSGFKFSTAASTTSTTNSGFNFGKATAPSISSGFSFGSSSLSSSTTTATTASTTGFSFGSGGLGSSSGVGGGGSTGGGFSFGALAAAKAATDKAQEGGAGGDDDEYVPPKPEVKEIKEEGSLFSKRCKLFYQKEGGWTERGVGNVHVKPLDGGNKTQLLIRADTNLGNILLNINVTSALPVSRQGKNNVLLVCVPNPPLKEGTTDPKPISMLIRVKTAEEADELLATLEQRKALL